jgi:glutamate-1-semialdehyde 2,1-aminomutase
MKTVNELEKEYLAKHPKSKQLYERALNSYASGVSHDSRYQRPFPIYATHAKGTKKWDVDGNEYVDYVMGHGGLLFGYRDEKIDEILMEQVEKAVHLGASSEIEIEWAELIQKLVPSARGGFVRATSCGGEAVQMAIRLARIHTGRDLVVLHGGSYHGKGDTTIFIRRGPNFGMRNARGIPAGVKDDVIVIPLNNLNAVESAFDTGEVSCILLQGNALYKKEYIKGIRELSNAYGVVFILDEVVSGFRYAAGGAQEYYGVTPDLSTLGKIIGGGAPVGAICGKKEILDYYSFKDDYWNNFVRIGVGGTWNAQPITIAGGIAAMKMIEKEKGEIYPKLYKIGSRLVKFFNEKAEDLGVSAFAFGLPIDDPTTIALNYFKEPIPPEKKYLWQTGPESFDDYKVKSSFSAGGNANYAAYLNMINNGIYLFGATGGILCTKHSDEDLNKTEAALGKTLQILKANSLIGKTN